MAPLDYRTARRSTAGLRFQEILSPKGRLDHENNACRPGGSPVNGAYPPSPSVYSVNSASSTYGCEQNVDVSQTTGYLSEEEEPCFSGPEFGPPRREREPPRPTSLVLRPASSGGPALQTLSPPPVRVSLAARRGTALPSPLPPAPSPRKQSRRSIRPSQHLHEPSHNVSEPRSSASLTPEEGLIQLQIRTQRADSNAPLGYRRSFRHVRGLTSRTLPTASRLLTLSISAAPVNARLDSLDDDETQSEYGELQIESVSASSSDESEPLSTPPGDNVPDITITRSRKDSSATSKHTHSSTCAREDKYASSFLDFEPGTPLSPPSPSPQSPFSVVQSQLFTYNDLYVRDGVDGPVELSYSVNDRTLSPSIPGASARQGGYSDGGKTRGSGTSDAYGTRVVGNPHRRRRSGVGRRSHRPRSRSSNNVTGRSGNWDPSGTNMASA